MTTPHSPTECPFCGAPLSGKAGGNACPACGAPLAILPGEVASLGARHKARIQEEAATLNARLMDAGAANAERAFNLGCWMSITLVVGAGVLVYFLAGRSWILVVITLIMASLAALWAIVLASDLAKTSAIRRTFQREVDPAINNLARRERLHRLQFEEIAHGTLPENAPLRRQLPPQPATPEAEGNE